MWFFSQLTQDSPSEPGKSIKDRKNGGSMGFYDFSMFYYKKVILSMNTV